MRLVVSNDITIGPINWDEVEGVEVVVPVKVNWPELQLTEDQLLANATALAMGRDPLFRDKSIFQVRIRR